MLSKKKNRIKEKCMPGWKMVIKWIEGFIKHPLTIIKSIYYRIYNRHYNMTNKRLKICKHCSSKESIKFVGDICGECGCILDNKTRIIDEKCDLGKW